MIKPSENLMHNEGRNAGKFNIHILLCPTWSTNLIFFIFLPLFLILQPPKSQTTLYTWDTTPLSTPDTEMNVLEEES